ncbi:hypothetical protein DM01DRAFT_83584 [Hesseltinella vesiculosa]|uniref:Uncharacterized protein n=1 Tax=Hesseltinella vesiculosa TaxID=101127 RepID=A0A1X2G5H5_9FUNG|nr:hypothetical protein DM01DRAFT_83584 [Hesseltinella vesiculosa]
MKQSTIINKVILQMEPFVNLFSHCGSERSIIKLWDKLSYSSNSFLARKYTYFSNSHWRPCWKTHPQQPFLFLESNDLIIIVLAVFVSFGAPG